MDSIWNLITNLFETSTFNQNSFCFNISEIIIQGGVINIPISKGSTEYFNLVQPLTKYGHIYISPSGNSLSYYNNDMYNQSFAADLYYNVLPITKFEVTHANIEKIKLRWVAIGY